MIDTRTDEIRERWATVGDDSRGATGGLIRLAKQDTAYLLFRIEELEREKPPHADYSDEITEEQMQAILEASKNGPTPALKAAYEFYKDNFHEH